MRAHELAERVPNYPGRKALERVLGPLVAPVTKEIAYQTVQRLVGFWVLTAVYGDVLALSEETGFGSRSGTYQTRKDFKAAFGVEVEELLPEIAAQIHESGLAVKLGFVDQVRPLKVAENDG